jgi:hypothetical protein
LGHREEKGSAIEVLFNFQRLSLDFFQVFLYTACCNDTTFLSCCQVKNRQICRFCPKEASSREITYWRKDTGGARKQGA